MEKIELQIQRIVRETADTISIHFEQPKDKIRYLSGQFLTLITEINGKEERRAYSLCSSAYTDDHLAVTIKMVTGGKVSNHFHQHARVGEKVSVIPPLGNFTYEPDHSKERQIVLIGGGSGITPLISILKTALTQEPAAIISLLYVNKSRDTTIFYKELEILRVEYLSRFRVFYYWGDEQQVEEPGWLKRLFGKKDADQHRIGEEQLNRFFTGLLIKSIESTEFYLCGPQGLMDLAERAVLNTGFEKRLIHRESFYDAKADARIIAMPKTTVRVKVILNGKDHEFDVPAKKSILLAGLDAGHDMPYSCQSGNCTACIGRCLSGEVEMRETEILTEDQIQNGYVLTCVGYPRSKDIVIEFEKNA